MPVSKRIELPTWSSFVAKWKDCRACPLCEQRDKIVLARGTVPCDILFIGEAPGANEDTFGLPFVGPAGRLLDQIIERSLTKEVTYALTNLVCCFPRESKLRGDNEPERSEILACRPRLVEFVNLARPRLIVCVGGLATEYVDHTDTVKCLDIIHPAATFPPRMACAQAEQAVQHTIVKLRYAVDEVLQTEHKPFTKWGTDAYLSQGRGLRQRYDAWTKDHADLDVAF